MTEPEKQLIAGLEKDPEIINLFRAVVPLELGRASKASNGVENVILDKLQLSAWLHLKPKDVVVSLRDGCCHVACLQIMIIIYPWDMKITSHWKEICCLLHCKPERNPGNMHDIIWKQGIPVSSWQERTALRGRLQRFRNGKSRWFVSALGGFLNPRICLVKHDISRASSSFRDLS